MKLWNRGYPPSAPALGIASGVLVAGALFLILTWAASDEIDWKSALLIALCAGVIMGVLQGVALSRLGFAEGRRVKNGTGAVPDISVGLELWRRILAWPSLLLMGLAFTAGIVFNGSDSFSMTLASGAVMVGTGIVLMKRWLSDLNEIAKSRQHKDGE